MELPRVWIPLLCLRVLLPPPESLAPPLGLGLGLEEVFVFDSKSDFRVRVRVSHFWSGDPGIELRLTVV